MKWDNNTPFYKQNLFWIGTTIFFMLLSIFSKNKNQIIICGNNNGSDNTSKDSPETSCKCTACDCEISVPK